jgi:hypothetical protein
VHRYDAVVHDILKQGFSVLISDSDMWWGLYNLNAVVP